MILVRYEQCNEMRITSIIGVRFYVIRFTEEKY